MTTGNIPPRFLSLEFHTRFFPAVLYRRLRPQKKEGVSFVSFGYMESAVGLAVGIILAAIGLPSAMTRGSLLGWAVGGLGLAGILAVIILNICARWGVPPSYDSFLAGTFFLLVAVGLTAGIFIGKLNHSLVLGICGSAAGLLAGYLLGIFIGLHLQYLGWIGVLINIFSGVAIIGVVVLDLVLLWG